jgi:uncharacterized peroxidase-related enzyme
VRDDEFVRSVSQNPGAASLNRQQLALVDLAIKLTGAPQSVEEADIGRLREHGFTDRAIHDVAAIVAYFNFVNRIASGLGVELEPDLRAEENQLGS